MKKYKVCIWVIGKIIILALIIGCASKMLPPREGWVRNYGFLDNTMQNSQEKENIRITLNLINEQDINKHPELFSFYPENWGPDWNPQEFKKRGVMKIKEAGKWSQSVYFWFPPDSADNYYAYTFPGMPAFFVSAKNSTGHILRMSDARIYLIIDGIDPIPAIYSFGKSDFVKTKMKLYGINESVRLTQSALERDKSLLDYICSYENNIITWLIDVKNSNPKFQDYPPYPFGLLSKTVVDNYRSYHLINEVGREILPGFSLNGILCFPYEMKPDQQAKIIFYDITKKTEEEGNPIKKTQFEFEFKYNPQYMKFDYLERKWKETKIE